MNPLRKKKLESSIRKEFSNLISRRRTKDDRIGFVSISQVELASDLSNIKIKLSLFGSEEDTSRTFRALKSNSKQLQSILSRNLRLRLTPQIHLMIDDNPMLSHHPPDMENSAMENPPPVFHSNPVLKKRF